jgi:hypothetical protein
MNTEALSMTPESVRGKIVQLGDALDAHKRLADLSAWLKEWREQDHLLEARVASLNPDKPADVQRGMQIASLRRRLRMRLVKHPLEISPEAIEKLKYIGLRDYMVSQYAQMSTAERLLWLHNLLFIMTPDIRELNRKIVNVRNYRSFGQQRNFLLGGHSGMGKTTYLDWYASNYIQTVESDRNRVPVIKVDAPVNNSSAKPLFQRMILECGRVFSPRDTDEDLLMKLVLFVQQCGVEMIIVDEIEHIERGAMRRRLLEISNLTRGTPIVCASCEPLKWAEGDVEVAGRWNDYFELKQYTEYRLRALLAYVELLLPFTEESHLGQTEIRLEKGKTLPGPATVIQNLTGGILRDIMILLADASSRAIEQGLPNLTLQLLETAWREIQSRQITDFLEILKRNEETMRRL